MTQPAEVDPAALFAEHLPRVRAVAYRLLGSLADTDDVVQEAWLRLQRTDMATVREPAAWLTTVTARLCLDHLRSARVRREQYVGPWLPEPIVVRAGEVADEIVLDESVSMAVLVVLETLTPAERVAFVLHDVFGMPFDDIATVTGRSAVACRKLASRGRTAVRRASPRTTADAEERRRVVDAFLAAARTGSIEALVAVLDPDVVWTADGGGAVAAARRPVVGHHRVARLLASIHATRRIEAVPASVNGGPGYLMRRRGATVGVVALRVAGGRVVRLDVVRNPAKLRSCGA